ncbi:IclR family transcriptional regulator C-terminal domain-containing protein [Streptomyces sp. ID01-12c]|nr:IclR family transcriptional regulator C-terminal domain-containing protein [Streptomyces caniscabiei]
MRHVGVGRRRRGRSAPRPRPSVRRLRPLLPYRAGPLRAHTPATITDSATRRRSLATVRRQGYAIMQNALIQGRCGIAAPVRDSQGTVVAAVSAVGPDDFIRPTRVVPHVRAAADDISRSSRAAGTGAGEFGA